MTTPTPERMPPPLPPPPPPPPPGGPLGAGVRGVGARRMIDHLFAPHWRLVRVNIEHAGRRVRGLHISCEPAFGELEPAWCRRQQHRDRRWAFATSVGAVDGVRVMSGAACCVEGRCVFSFLLARWSSGARRGRRVRRDGPAARIGKKSECVPSGSRVNYKAKELSSDKDGTRSAAARRGRPRGARHHRHPPQDAGRNAHIEKTGRRRGVMPWVESGERRRAMHGAEAGSLAPLQRLTWAAHCVRRAQSLWRFHGGGASSSVAARSIAVLSSGAWLLLLNIISNSIQLISPSPSRSIIACAESASAPSKLCRS